MAADTKNKDDIINLHVPSGCRAQIRRAADDKCMTIQRFIREAINSFAG